MTPDAFFHEDSDAVRFWVLCDGQAIGSSVSRQTLHFRYRPEAANDMPLETFAQHVAELQAAVRRRVAKGSIEPVMIREHDLRPGAT